ncbi:uncharacterized transmembrane protein DDB_G0289901-like isoform X2 [Archocentrus centrarchus]|uniref:uncharacterized transmembrane protein DDB_G0289901-like isoform X2 n=1 Tax=Archocentrus centrarchus TaxID=63155 RepID=UPI0011E9FF47|nr:uncharacterized transmembrane protein DDB_G0289901-like isoform X2 [Archocentrus centrarchus]
MVLEIVLSSGACFPVTTNDSAQTSSDVSTSDGKVGTGPGSGPDGSTGEGFDPSPDKSSEKESGPGSSAGGWSFGADGSTGGWVGPGSSTGGWSFGADGSTGGWVGPGSSTGGWSLGAGGSRAGRWVSGASGHTEGVGPRWASGYNFVGGFPQGFPAVSSPFFHTWNWIPSRPFPDFSAWYTYEAPLSMVAQPPQMPSSYVVQTGNGYQRGREVLSHSKYSNNIFGYPPQSPVLPQYPGSVPVTGSQWTKVY